METKRQLVKEAYIKPCASPNVRPGGDAGGSIRVIEQTVDDEDTDLEG